MNRANDQPLAHHDTGKAKRRVKLAAVSAKITWIGKLTWFDRKTILEKLNIQNHGREQ
jgi:hypothetical protein